MKINQAGNLGWEVGDKVERINGTDTQAQQESAEIFLASRLSEN